MSEIEEIVHRRRWPAATAAALIALVCGVGVGWWSARTLLQAPPDVLADPGYVVAEANVGEVGQSLRLTARGSWETVASVNAQIEGVVTGVAPVSGTIVQAGDHLYDVNLRPTVIAQGAVPGFRDLTRGAAGADVAQLQELLIALGHLTGSADGQFGDATHAAVLAWQRSLGLGTGDDLGTVRPSDIVYVPSLPARIQLADEVASGLAPGGRMPVLSVLQDAPIFEMALGDTQFDMVEQGMAVTVEGPSGSWSGTVAEVRPGDSESPASAVLAGPDGAALCGESCEAVSTSGATPFEAVIDVVPTVRGVTVPSGALTTDASGCTGVVLESGSFVEVTVLAAARGMAVVDGIAAGDLVRLTGS